MSVGDNIRRLREKAGMTQDELAQRVNVCRSTVTLWEGNYTVPRIRRLAHIAEALDATYADIVADDKKQDTAMSVFVPLLTIDEVSRLPAPSSASKDIVPLCIEMQEYRSVEVPPSLLDRHKNAFALLMPDDHMSRFAPRGMAVVFDPALKPANGRVVILTIPDRGTVARRWYRGNSNIMLVAEGHSACEDIVVPHDLPMQVHGTAVWVQSPFELG